MMRTKCHKCGFIWTYNGERMIATCPNCGYKTKVIDLDDDDE